MRSLRQSAGFIGGGSDEASFALPVKLSGEADLRAEPPASGAEYTDHLQESQAVWSEATDLLECTCAPASAIPA